MKMKSLLLLLSSLWLLNGVFAKEIPARPQTMVNDYAGVLSPAQANALEQKLRAYEDSTSTQIAIVIDRSLEGEDAFEYSFRLAQAWGIGQKDKDNGVLIYVAQAERKIRIVTNVGVQGFLTDALSKRIIENTITPAFKKGDFYAGLDGAVNDIIKVAAGEYKADKSKDTGKGGAMSFFILLLIIFSVITMFRYLSRRSAQAGGGYYGGGRYNDRGNGPGGGWIIFPGGGFGGGGSDRNSDWGGSGGDDWGGFGGSDGFDGGGAGGDW
ncbi:YgcG family protein [Haliscomenobacter sp.]|uniref:TPM domain-containing protein n=1 Tax=Haliscomenobacter sp. TaxID=2717303 RepID=UPI0035937C1F